MEIKTTFVIVRVSQDFKKKLLKQAKEQKRTLSDWARNALESIINETLTKKNNS